ncbi:hypothetical protein C4D60_Mb04t19330 [Musa balbisiana]|uniref:E2F/DP family winged-helix DNA-binding domain-containing protein n=1 Tax=Musa balbisiana TaxID=52838 RepID=A0A4S8KD88_MUSBA|nr:hypothetical protein C4D60_Mb04t19330 [Musa balbisiana]
MSSAEDSVKLPPPLLRRSHIALPPSSPAAVAANRRFPGSSTTVDRPRLFLGRSPPGAAENDKIPPPDTPNKKEMHEAEKKDIQSADGAINQALKEEFNGSTIPTGLGIAIKRQRKTKLKSKHLELHTSGSTDGTHLNPLASNSCRYDSSLGLLTKKFIDLLHKAKDGSLDLNTAAETLEVQKRRIYDITNVLEGVGLIEKTFKNKIRWKGIDMSRPKELDDQIARMKAEVEALYSEDCRLDEMIREIQESLWVFTEDENHKKGLYLTKEDITSIPCLQDAVLIAIKAPHGTSVEVPDPDEGIDFPQRRYQIFLRSSIGPINCFLISNHMDRFGASNHSPQEAATDSCIQSSSSNNGISLQPTEQDAGQGYELEGPVPPRILLDSIISNDCMGGIVKIVPSDVDIEADYWLFSDLRSSITDAWRTECILELNRTRSCISLSNADILT